MWSGFSLPGSPAAGEDSLERARKEGRELQPLAAFSQGRAEGAQPDGNARRGQQGAGLDVQGHLSQQDLPMAWR